METETKHPVPDSNCIVTSTTMHVCTFKWTLWSDDDGYNNGSADDYSEWRNPTRE